MNTPIGKTIQKDRVRLYISLGIITITFYYDVTSFLLLSQSYLHRSFIAVSAFLVLFLVFKCDYRSLGIRLQPLQGYTYWIRAGFLIGIVILFLDVIAIFIMSIFNIKMPIYAVYPSMLWSELTRICFWSPLVEEIIYRIILCAPLVAFLKPSTTIFVGGCIFSALHIVYGNPGVDNIIAGFILTWAYLKSGSILVPFALHSLGNLFVLVIYFARYGIYQ